MAYPIFFREGEFGQGPTEFGYDKKRIISKTFSPSLAITDHPPTYTLHPRLLTRGVDHRDHTAKNGPPLSSGDSLQESQELAVVLSIRGPLTRKSGGVHPRFAT